MTNIHRFSEKDWRLFRSKIVDWQEAYMEKMNKEYIELLSGKGNASEKFGHWRNEFEKIRKIVECSVK